MPFVIGSAIGAALFAAGAPLVIVNFAALALPGILINLALSVGLSIVANALLAKTSPLPSPSDGQQEIRQALSERVRSYGRVRLGLRVSWYAAIGRVLYLGGAINHGLISRFVSFHIDENQVDIDVNDKVTSTPYSAGNVFIHSRLGAVPEIKYSELLTSFGVDEMRGDGVATILATFENPTAVAAFQNTYPAGQPEVRATIEASRVFDPRDSAQSRDDPTTWLWSDNAIACLLDYVTHADGYGIPWEDVERNLDQWIEAMDVCDEGVPLLAGGAGARYRVAGTYRLPDDPRDVVAKFLSACDGRMWVKRDGSIGVSAGKFIAPMTPTLTGAHITGYTDFVRGQDPLRAVAGVRGEYMSPDHDYREHEAEPWPDGATVMDLTEDRTVTVDVLWAPSNSQARRLMKRVYTRARAAWQGTVHTDAFGLHYIDERYLSLQLTELGIDTTFEILRFSFDPSALTCEIDVVAVDASIDDWTAAEEGAQEALTLGFESSFTKAGTTVNVLTEAGAEVGDYALVFASNNTSTPADPSGWTPILGVSQVGQLFSKAWGRLIDGSEGVITVNGAVGAIIVVLLRGVRTATFLNVGGEVINDFFDHTWNSAETPFAVFGFASANTDFDEPNWIRLVSMPGKVDIEEQSIVMRAVSPTNTAHVELAIYRSDETPPVQHRVLNQTDRGFNGIIRFNLTPG